MLIFVGVETIFTELLTLVFGLVFCLYHVSRFIIELAWATMDCDYSVLVVVVVVVVMDPNAIELQRKNANNSYIKFASSIDCFKQPTSTVTNFTSLSSAFYVANYILE